jgi:hypothetical protein
VANKPIIKQSIVDEDLDKALKELDKLFIIYPPKIKGDITTADLMKSRGLSRYSARELMNKTIELYPEIFEKVKVQTGGISWQWVLRKK